MVYKKIIDTNIMSGDKEREQIRMLIEMLPSKGVLYQLGLQFLNEETVVEKMRLFIKEVEDYIAYAKKLHYK